MPPLANVFIALTKNTSIAAAFGVVELTAVTTRLANANGDAVLAIFLLRRRLLPGPDPAVGLRWPGGWSAGWRWPDERAVLYDAAGPRGGAGS